MTSTVTTRFRTSRSNPIAMIQAIPVVAATARPFKRTVLRIVSHTNEQTAALSADWLLLTNDAVFIRRVSGLAVRNIPGRTVRPWTDDYSNIFGILKKPHKVTPTA